MHFDHNESLEQAIARNVRDALMEDIGRGDWTAALVDAGQRVRAQVVAKEAAVICGRPWFDACVLALDATAQVEWPGAPQVRQYLGLILDHIHQLRATARRTESGAPEIKAILLLRVVRKVQGRRVRHHPDLERACVFEAGEHTGIRRFRRRV